MTHNSAPITLVVDDHPFMRGGVCEFLRQSGWQVVEAADEAAARAAAQGVDLSAAVLDLVIPPDSQAGSQASAACGLRLGRTLKQANPALGLVFLSSNLHFGDEVYGLLRQWQRGIAYKAKTSPPADLLKALHLTMRGGVLVDPQVLSDPRPLVVRLVDSLTAAERPWVLAAVDALSAPSGLTPREREVARLMAAARTRDGIALSLGIDLATVSTHVTRIYGKLGLNEMRLRAAELSAAVVLAKAHTLADLQQGENANDPPPV